MPGYNAKTGHDGLTDTDHSRMFAARDNVKLDSKPRQPSNQSISPK